MMNWLKNIFQRETPPAPPVISESEVLVLQKEAQALRMEMQARDESIAKLKQEIERQRARQEQIINETVNTRLVTIFTDLAAPASQILTQADLLENQGKPVQARDVLSVARRMVRTLERHGMVFDGNIGSQAAFDPDRHTPMNASTTPQDGQPVTIRFAGVAYQGKTIYKAIVE